jgi:hypothetical protein
MPHNKGSSIIPITSQINPIPRIDTYLFKIYSSIVLPSTRTFHNINTKQYENIDESYRLITIRCKYVSYNIEKKDNEKC